MIKEAQEERIKLANKIIGLSSQYQCYNSNVVCVKCVQWAVCYS